jgi:ABC-type branched-subunit amino acid transport system ATPase component
MSHPTLIMLDEPSMALPAVVAQIFEIIKELNNTASPLFWFNERAHGHFDCGQGLTCLKRLYYLREQAPS